MKLRSCACILVVLFLSVAGRFPLLAQEIESFEVFIDVDNDSNTGTTRELGGITFVDGVEFRLAVSVQSDLLQPQVVSLELFRLLASGEELRWSESASWPVGLNLGADGADVVEGFLPLEQLGVTGEVRFYVLAISDRGDTDVITQAQGSDIIFRFPAVIPTLGTWALLIYMGLLAFVALFILRRKRLLHSHGNVLLLLVAMILTAAVCNIALDGNIDDWQGVPVLAEDPVGDTNFSDPAADLNGFYACTNGNSMFFRLDVFDVENGAPIAVDDEFLAFEDNDSTFSVLINDIDPDGGPLTIVAVGSPTHGDAYLLDPGIIGYTPDPDYFGEDTFTYTVEDEFGLQATATVRLDVRNVNDTPQANDDAVTVQEDSQDTLIDALQNDSFAPDVDEVLTIISVSVPTQGGSVNIAADNLSVSYTPLPDFFGQEAFEYTISDGNGGSNTGVVRVQVDAVNDDPTANDDSFSVDEDTTDNALAVLDNDEIAPDEDETLTITAVGVPNQAGSVNISADSTNLLYTPAADFFGAETFTYTISDGNGGTDTATVNITVGNQNDDPQANPDLFNIAEDSAAQDLDVLANDTSAPDATKPLLITAVGMPDQGGTATITGDSLNVNYAPAVDFFGTETFTYTISDGNGGTDSTTVTVEVANVNDDPTANPDSFAFDEDSSVQNLNVLSNDEQLPDSGETLTITNVGTPDNGGSAVIGGGATSIDYTPAANFFGIETFTYTISDGNGGSDTTTVTITVNAVNDDPTANPDSYAFDEDSSVQNLTVLNNDSFAPDSGETLTITNVGTPDNGGSAVLGGGATSIDYTPAANFFGIETFTYTIGDGNGGSDTTTVTITVNAVNDDPTANDDIFTVMENSSNNPLDVLVNDSFAPDTGETLTISAVGATSLGGNVVNNGTSLSYTPPATVSGTESFTYTISDGNGGDDTATVTINVTSTNQPPQAVADTPSVNEDSVGNVLTVLSNDSDPDMDSFTITAVGTPDQGGSVMISGGGSNLTYTPVADYFGTESFTYTITDSEGAMAMTNVTVTVQNINDDPTASADSFNVTEDSMGNMLAPLVNDSFVPDSGETLTITAVGMPDQGGSVMINGGTMLDYTPAADFSGTESFTYTIADGNGGNDTATVTVTVDAVNDIPNAATDNYTVIGNTLFYVDTSGDIGAPPAGLVAFSSTLAGVLDNDSDPEMDTLSVVVETIATTQGGSVDMRADGSFAYSPPPGNTTADSFVYQLQDNGTPVEMTTGTVNLTIQEMIWYIDNSNSDPSPDGTSVSPFTSLQDFTSAPFAAGDIIYIREGDTTTMGQELDGEIVLLDEQQLLGEGVALTVPHPEIPGDLTLNAAGNQPHVRNTSGDGILLEEVTDVVVRGLDLDASGNTIVIVNAAVGTFTVTVSDNTIVASSGNAIDVSGLTNGTVVAQVENNSLSANMIALNAPIVGAELQLAFNNNTDTGSGVTALALMSSTITAFSDNTFSGDGENAISLTDVTFDATPGLPLEEVNAGTLNLGSNGNALGGSGFNGQNLSGFLSIDDLQSYSDDAGIVLTGSGTFDAVMGGFRLDVTTGVVQAGGGIGFRLNQATGNVLLADLQSTNSSTVGFEVSDSEGTYTLQSATLNGAAQAGLRINGGSSAVTFNTLNLTSTSGTAIDGDNCSGLLDINAGTLTHEGGRILDLNGMTGGLDLAGATLDGNANSGILIQNSSGGFTFASIDISDTATAIDIQNHSGTTNFNAAITITNSSVAAINLNGLDSAVDLPSLTVTGSTMGTVLTAANTTAAVDIQAGSTNHSGGRIFDLDNLDGGADFSGFTISGQAHEGIAVVNSDNATFELPAFTVSSAASVDVVALSANPGATFNFADLNLTNLTTTGLNASNSGTLNLSGGTAIINTDGDSAVELDTVAANLSFANLTSANSSGHGLHFLNVSGTLAASAGSISASADHGLEIEGSSGTFNFDNLMVQQTAGAGIRIDGGAPTVDFDSTTVNNTTGGGQGLRVLNVTGGSLDFDSSSSITVAGLSSSSRDGVELDGEDTNFSATLDAITINADSGDDGLSVINVGTGGSITFNDSVIIQDSADDGMYIIDVGGTVTFNGAVTVNDAVSDCIDLEDTFMGGQVSFNGLTSLMQATDGISVEGNSGTITFSNASINQTGSDGIFYISSDGTFSLTGDISNAGDDGIQFRDNSGGTFTLTGDIDTPSDVGVFVEDCDFTLNLNGDLLETGNDALAVDGNAPTINLTGNIVDPSIDGIYSPGSGAMITVMGDISGAGEDGIDLEDFTGTLNMTGDILNAVDDGVALTRGDGSLTLTGSITTAGDRPFLANDKTGGTVTIQTGTIDADEGGIRMRDNSNSTTFNFNGTLDIDTGNRDGISIAGGGVLNITGANNSIVTTSGIPIEIEGGTTIGASGITLLEVSCDGASRGIYLDGTGSNPFTVTGTGTTDGSGGTIQNMTGRGVTLLNAENVSLANMNFSATASSDGASDCGDDATGNSGCNAAIHMGDSSNVTLTNINTDGGQYGINGTNVNGFTLMESTIENHGNEVDEHGIRFANLSGTVSITNNTIQSNDQYNLYIYNDGTTNLSSLSLTGNNLLSAQNESGFSFIGSGSSMASLTLTGNTISNNAVAGLHVGGEGSATIDLTLSTTTSSGNQRFADLTVDESAQLTFDIDDNTGINATQSGVSLSLPATSLGAALAEGFIRNNTITISAATATNGIDINHLGAGNSTLAITNNTVTYSGLGDAVNAQFGDGNGTMSMTLSGNTFAQNNAGGLFGLAILSGTTAGDSGSLCLDLANNTISSAATADAIEVTQAFGNTFQLEGLGAVDGTSDTDVETYLEGQNPLSGSVEVSPAAGNTVVNYTDAAGCTEPTP